MNIRKLFFGKPTFIDHVILKHEDEKVTIPFSEISIVFRDENSVVIHTSDMEWRLGQPTPDEAQNYVDLVNGHLEKWRAFHT